MFIGKGIIYLIGGQTVEIDFGKQEDENKASRIIGENFHVPIEIAMKKKSIFVHKNSMMHIRGEHISGYQSKIIKE